MFGSKISVKQQDNMRAVADLVRKLGRKEVYVGIPEQQTARQHGKITNAQLAYIHSHGIRDKQMRQVMANMMDGHGRPFDPRYNQFLQNMDKMPYSVAYQMYLHTYGSPRWQSPPRPIIEPAIAANKEPIAEELGAAAKAALSGSESTCTQHLQRAGMMGQNAARNWFDDPRNNWPPNAPSTVAAKGSDRPLIDTGQLRKAITYIVGEKGAND